MLDPAFFQDKISVLQDALKKRHADPELFKQVSQLFLERKKLMQDGEKLKAERNAASQEIGKLMARAKTDEAAAKEAAARQAQTRAIGDQVKAIDEKIKLADAEFEKIALS